MRKKRISIVIADDHAILRSGLRMLLDAQPDMKVVGEAENGDQALEQVRLKKPDILLLDITMPGTSGVEVASEVGKRSPLTRVVILTMHEEPAFLDSALAAGVSGYVLKRALDSDLVSAIRAAHEGKTFIDSGVAGHLVKKALGFDDYHKVTARQACNLLSRRELQVLKLVAEGYTNQQIASQVFLSVKSVETYRARLLRKLQISTRQEIVRFAIAVGLLLPKPEL
jgi:two-component system response regulator NreC